MYSGFILAKTPEPGELSIRSGISMGTNSVWDAVWTFCSAPENLFLFFFVMIKLTEVGYGDVNNDSSH